MFVISRKNIFMLISLVFLIGYMAYIAFSSSAIVANAPLLPNTIIIDAGHGGMDGGTVGCSGALEKDLNLSVAEKLKECAEKAGYTVIMTRSEDTSLHSGENLSIRQQKRSDLEYRKSILTESGALAFISIHMNNFQNPKYKGAQVFYANNDKSKILGEAIQKSLIDGIDNNNNRAAQVAPTSIYTLKGVAETAVIVECGFLSNPEEEKLLTQPDYQQKVAECILNGLNSYKNGN